eukprot:5720596-Amphidinium_carterae.3
MGAPPMSSELKIMHLCPRTQVSAITPLPLFVVVFGYNVQREWSPANLVSLEDMLYAEQTDHKRELSSMRLSLVTGTCTIGTCVLYLAVDVDPSWILNLSPSRSAKNYSHLVRQYHPIVGRSRECSHWSKLQGLRNPGTDKLTSQVRCIVG